MAEFRKLFYALGLASLLAAASSTALAAVQCTASVANPPIIRDESFAELVGDIIVDCVGGPSTSVGDGVLPINITITANTVITSRLLDKTTDAENGFFTESLLVIDEPSSPINKNRALLACGNSTNAPYVTNAPGTCAIIGGADPRLTYDGTSGHPNVFQGRVSPSSNSRQELVWNGVPFDPPGTVVSGEPPAVVTVHRILRFTNIRVLPLGAAAPGDFLTPINVEININGQDITLSGSSGDSGHNLLRVASVQKGLDLDVPLSTGVLEYLQCEAQNIPADSAGLSPVIFREGFASSFKAEQWGDIERNGYVNGGVWTLRGLELSTSSGDLDTATETASYVSTGSGVAGTTPLRQNVPGGLYFTESGLTSPSTGFATPNPNAPVSVAALSDPPLPAVPNGIYPISPATSVLSNTTGITDAGRATNGTRFFLQLKDVPAGATVTAPQYAYLYRAGTYFTSTGAVNTGAVKTGVAIRVSVGSRGDDGQAAGFPGDNTPVVNTPTTTANPNPRTGYEIIFSRSQIREELVIKLGLQYNPNLPSNFPNPVPNPPTTALVSGSIAPFANSGDTFAQATLGAGATAPGAPTATSPTTSAPYPRFRNDGFSADTPLFRINKCACNLLFPFVSSINGPTAADGNFDTGIAIANTSKLPANPFFAPNPLNSRINFNTQQQGPVEFFYFQALALPGTGGVAEIPSQCTNSTTAGTCPGNIDVRAGETLTYVLSQGSTRWGLDNRANNFQGYMIAQAGFKYCHGFAYISAEGVGPLAPGMSVGYLALLLDDDDSIPRTAFTGEVLGN